MFYLPLSFLVGDREAESAGPSPHDTWISVATLCQRWPHLRMLALQLGTRSYQMAKSQAVLMDCTAVSPEDTRGQEALTKKLRLDLKGIFCLLFMHTLGRPVVLNSADTLECPLHSLEGAELKLLKEFGTLPSP